MRKRRSAMSRRLARNRTMSPGRFRWSVRIFPRSRRSPRKAAPWSGCDGLAARREQVLQDGDALPFLGPVPRGMRLDLIEQAPQFLLPLLAIDAGHVTLHALRSVGTND